MTFMKISVITSSRLPNWPLWAVVLLSVWLILVLITVFLENIYKVEFQLCVFYRLTGLPCPTCGSTRGVLRAFNGEFVKAWLTNPFIFTMFMFIFFRLAGQLFFAKKITIIYSRLEQTIAYSLLLGFFILNWIYLLFYLK